jgi:hypothetical protein
MNDEKVKRRLGVAYRFELVIGQRGFWEVWRWCWPEIVCEVKVPS